MEKVFIVVDVSDSSNYMAVLRVFGNYLDAIAYGNENRDLGFIQDFDVYEREVY